MLTSVQKQKKELVLWVGITIAVLLMSLVVIIDSVKAKNQIHLFREEDNLAAWVQTIFVVGFAVVCFHSNWLLKQAHVREIHGVRSFGISVAAIMNALGVTLVLLGLLLLIVAYTSRKLNV